MITGLMATPLVALRIAKIEVVGQHINKIDGIKSYVGIDSSVDVIWFVLLRFWFMTRHTYL
jgi:hypothetical protein